MEIPLLNDIEIIFGLSIAILFLCLRLHTPAIVGFLTRFTLNGEVFGPGPPEKVAEATGLLQKVREGDASK